MMTLKNGEQITLYFESDICLGDYALKATITLSEPENFRITAFKYKIRCPCFDDCGYVTRDCKSKAIATSSLKSHLKGHGKRNSEAKEYLNNDEKFNEYYRNNIHQIFIKTAI